LERSATPLLSPYSLLLSVPPFANLFPLGKREKKGERRNNPFGLQKEELQSKLKGGRKALRRDFILKQFHDELLFFTPSLLRSPLLPFLLWSGAYFLPSPYFFGEERGGKKAQPLLSCFATPCLFRRKKLFFPLWGTKRSKE